ncbi:hypothetical protein JCM19294_2622 [Nonlabens tegetincola]|uniref:Uncharacterized protein n=1 Tax=Nonlabens tegetincola TaxID=323273 RepID=A0A090PYG9_9FLAO|nr:hypothetical protein JCM19294_2622 [Nonlabens tegetincola]
MKGKIFSKPFYREWQNFIFTISLFSRIIALIIHYKEFEKGSLKQIK